MSTIIGFMDLYILIAAVSLITALIVAANLISNEVILMFMAASLIWLALALPLAVIPAGYFYLQTTRVLNSRRWI